MTEKLLIRLEDLLVVEPAVAILVEFLKPILV